MDYEDILTEGDKTFVLNEMVRLYGEISKLKKEPEKSEELKEKEEQLITASRVLKAKKAQEERNSALVLKAKRGSNL